MDNSHDTHAAIRRHYLSLPGRTEDNWCGVVVHDVTKFNQIWRHMLKTRCGVPWLEINSSPPPADLRAIVPEDFDALRS